MEPTASASSITEVGYGDSDNSGNGSGVLRTVVVTTIDCAATHDSELSGDNLLCFDPRSGQASCDGDRGGPAFVTVDGALRVAGINSGNTGNTCTTGWELYTAVAGELDFINMYLPDGGSDTEPPDPGTPDQSTSVGCRVASRESGLLLVVIAFLLRRRRREREVIGGATFPGPGTPIRQP